MLHNYKMLRRQILGILYGVRGLSQYSLLTNQHCSQTKIVAISCIYPLFCHGLKNYFSACGTPFPHLSL